MSFTEEYIVESRIMQRTYQDALKCLKDSVEKKNQFDSFNNGRNALLSSYEARSKIDRLKEIEKDTNVFKESSFQEDVDEITKTALDDKHTDVFNKYKRIFQFSDWIFRKYFKGFDDFEFNEDNNNEKIYEILDNGISNMKGDIDNTN